MPEEKQARRSSTIPKDKTGEDVRRIKDDHSDHNNMTSGLSDNMRGFYTELSQIFPEIRITSGKRSSSPSGNFSHHHEGDAIDIGKEHTDVFEYLYNTQDGLTLMNKYGLGILDETDPRTMEKTNATGPHFHIGKDSGLYQKTKDRYEQFDSVQPIQSFYSQNPTFDYSNPSNTEGANFNLMGNYNPDAEVYLKTDGISPFRLVLPNQQISETFIGELAKEQEKEQIKEGKIEESEHRKMLEEKEREQREKVQQVFQTMGKIRARDENSLKKEESSGSYLQPVEQPSVSVQRSLPNLPSIFKIQ